MAKTSSQRTKEHIARLRRKAQAYDVLTSQLEAIFDETAREMPSDWENSRHLVQVFLRKAAEKVAQS